jgi:catechol 2,3-dioxygenase-like lactoylglutathione lyase family enzyme
MRSFYKVLLLILLVGAAPQVNGQAVVAVEKVSIVVSHLDRSVRFYEDAFGFRQIGMDTLVGEGYERLFDVFGMNAVVAHMQLGEEQLDLIDFLTVGGSPIPPRQKSNDLSFQHIAIVVRDMDAAFAQLKKVGVDYVSTAPQTLPASIKPAAGVKAFYFRDPDGHNLELIYFPKDKGNPKWQNPQNPLFMGIDHTAIGISSTANSLKTYQQWLGLDVKGESFNKGVEQAHLNNVEGASLHITGLRAGAIGPGVEFLEYLVPGPGKPFPSQTRSDDYWNYFTTLRVKDVTKLFNEAKKNKYMTISRDLISVSGRKQFMMRDGDGHALWLQE